jgi:hypothetical protein
MDLAPTMRQCLEDCDVQTVRHLWKHVAPHLPQPQSDAETLACIHRARTEAQSISLNLRAYSHRWLEDRGWPSGLPDELKPRAERLYPKTVSAVGIAVRISVPQLSPAALEIRGAMERVVLEAEADGKLEEAPFVKGRMQEARAKAKKQLFG